MSSTNHPPAAAPTSSSEAAALAPSSSSPTLTSAHVDIAATTTAASSSSAPAPGHHDDDDNDDDDDAQGREPATSAAGAAELARTKLALLGATKRFPDFPIPGIAFIDILPLFQDAEMHERLLRALELQVLERFGGDGDGDGGGGGGGGGLGLNSKDGPDVIVGLEARGFLFGPSLALRLKAGFVPVRKKGKLPGPCVTAAYEKEYGTDYFEMQEDVIRPGQKVLIVDDIIATGGSAQAAGSLVRQLGGTLMGYLFIMEIPFLKGRDKLGHVPVVTLFDTNESD